MGIRVFATNRHFNKLRDCTVLYMAGTFKSCPRPYTQFLTIYGLFHCRCLPLVMALMTERTIAAYRQIFKHAKAKVRPLTGHRLRPRRIVIDFEVCLITATETKFRVRRHPALRGFIRYMELNYVNPGVTFPIRMWSLCL
ncbi:Hypp6752 [Branchiostoma lanceolatum]|uniref:Hypp6752 protein n=1 Tax=Branchiostoma lanceolatum TaxID=7740 RepID=A0A8J9YVM4_BRALA|nr:Hypp6752 [Branchiostoma lanceolatum]